MQYWGAMLSKRAMPDDAGTTKRTKGVTKLLLQSSLENSCTIVTIDIESARFSTMLHGMIEGGLIDASAPFTVPASTAAIQYTAEWMEIHLHPEMQPLGNARHDHIHCTNRFTSIVSLADFLDVAPLRANLLGSFGMGAGLSHLRACLAAIPHLLSLLCSTVFTTAEQADVAALLAAIEATTDDDACASGLTYEQLDLCDGRGRVGGSLGLTNWTEFERSRRRAAVEATVQSHECARQAAIDAGTTCSVEKMDKELWDAVVCGKASEAQSAFDMGGAVKIMRRPVSLEEEMRGKRSDPTKLESASTEFLEADWIVEYPKLAAIGEASDWREPGKTPMSLLLAAAGMPSMVHWLLDRGAQPDLGQPLFSYSHMHMYTITDEHLRDLFFGNTHESVWGHMSPLCLLCHSPACQGLDLDQRCASARALLSRGAEVNFVCFGIFDSGHKHGDSSCDEFCNYTPLIFATRDALASRVEQAERFRTKAEFDAVVAANKVCSDPIEEFASLLKRAGGDLAASRRVEWSFSMRWGGNLIMKGVDDKGKRVEVHSLQEAFDAAKVEFVPPPLTFVEPRPTPLVHALLEYGADVNFATRGGAEEPSFSNLCRNRRTKPLRCYWAEVVTSGNVTHAQALLETYGANPNWPHPMTEAQHLRCHPQVPPEANQFFPTITVLLLAIIREDVPMVRCLLEHGADPNLPGLLPSHPGEKGSWLLPSLRLWDGNGFNLDRIEPQYAATPLSTALHIQHAEIIRLLHERGARCDPRNQPLPRHRGVAELECAPPEWPEGSSRPLLLRSPDGQTYPLVGCWERSGLLSSDVLRLAAKQHRYQLGDRRWWAVVLPGMEAGGAEAGLEGPAALPVSRVVEMLRAGTLQMNVPLPIVPRKLSEKQEELRREAEREATMLALPALLLEMAVQYDATLAAATKEASGDGLGGSSGGAGNVAGGWAVIIEAGEAAAAARIKAEAESEAFWSEIMRKREAA